jgi:uncharacterized protein YbjT (DUF2867 family)
MRAGKGAIMKPVILVTGASGKTGFPIVGELASAGVPVRALVHTKAKKNMFENMREVELVEGDYNDTRSLEGALNGIHTAYLVSPPSPDQVRLQTNFVNMARLTGLKHVVKLSALGTGTDSPVGLLRDHAEIEDYIRKTGIAYTFLHPHFFMDNLLGDSESVTRDGVLYSPLGDARIAPIAVQDIASVAARILIDGGHRGTTYVLTGPESMTFSEIAAVWSKVIGKTIRYSPVSFDAARQGMVLSGMPAWLAQDIVRLMKTWAEGKGDIASNYVERIIGRKPISIQEFLMAHKSQFLKVA